MVIVGVGEDHVAITQPLVEVFPPATNQDAEVRVIFEQEDQPVMLGIEGALGFLRAHAPDGSVVLDRIVELTEDTVTVPPNDYVLFAYYRTCDGSCTLLDPEQEFCSVDAALDPGGRYELSVTIVEVQRAECVLTSVT
jgi:hypothetical protein